MITYNGRLKCSLIFELRDNVARCAIRGRSRQTPVWIENLNVFVRRGI